MHERQKAVSTFTTKPCEVSRDVANPQRSAPASDSARVRRTVISKRTRAGFIPTQVLPKKGRRLEAGHKVQGKEPIAKDRRRWTKSQRALETGERLGEPALPGERICQVTLRDGVGSELERAPAHRERIIELARRRQSYAKIVICLRGFGMSPNGFPVGSDGFLNAATGFESIPRKVVLSP